MLTIAVKKEEVDEVLNQCSESEDTGHSKFPGMTYEQGVQSAIRWMIGEEKESPLTD